LEPPPVIELIQKRHNRKSFDCGVADLTEYVRRYARQNDTQGFGRTYVAVEKPLSNEVLGYYTIGASSVNAAHVPEAGGLPQRVPSVLMGRLAVDVNWRGHGIGEELLFHAFKTAMQVADVMGAYFFEVNALDEKARNFYLLYEFQSFLDDQLHLFLELAAIRSLGL